MSSRQQRNSTIILCLLQALLFGAVLAQPGSLIELSGTGTLSAAQVDARTAGRFRNNGEAAPTAITAVDTYLLSYESTWPNGEPARITAQLFVPHEIATPADLLVFAPGSTGLVEACAPSRPFVENGSYETYNAYTLAYAGQGFISLMPNYMGFFDVGVIQPYFDRVAEGRVLLDGIRAANAAFERLELGVAGLPAYVAGYSQGGHAAFAAADLYDDYAPEVDLAGVVGFGPTTILANLFLEFTYVSPWVVYSFETFQPERIDPAAFMREPYLSRLMTDAERLCILGAQAYYPADPGAIYVAGFVEALRSGTLAREFPQVAELFEENDAGLGGHGLPAIILQGVDDPVVSIESQHSFVAQLCEDGSRVRYPNYLRTRHETRYIGFWDAIGWMHDLTAGAEPPSDCGLIPEPAE